MTKTRQILRNLTFANQLTFLRLAVIPFFVLALLDNRHELALALFAAAAITDVLDGLIARILKQQTALGALLDPIADKLLLTTALITLTLPDHLRVAPEFTLVNRVPVWLTVLALSRDVIILLTAGVMYLVYGITRFPPSRLGKLTTFCLIVLVSLTLYLNSRQSASQLAVPLACWAALAFILGSGFNYVFHTGRLIHSAEPPQAAAGVIAQGSSAATLPPVTPTSGHAAPAQGAGTHAPGRREGA